jgi:hypothetical protein
MQTRTPLRDRLRARLRNYFAWASTKRFRAPARLRDSAWNILPALVLIGLPVMLMGAFLARFATLGNDAAFPRAALSTTLGIGLVVLVFVGERAAPEAPLAAAGEGGSS